MVKRHLVAEYAPKLFGNMRGERRKKTDEIQKNQRGYLLELLEVVEEGHELGDRRVERKLIDVLAHLFCRLMKQEPGLLSRMRFVVHFLL